jgi:hypothetical protein
LISTSSGRKGVKSDVREAFLNGSTIQAICSAFKVSENFVLSCLKPKDLVQLSELILTKLLASPEGMTAAEIASELVVEKSIVNSILYYDKQNRFRKSLDKTLPRWFPGIDAETASSNSERFLAPIESTEADRKIKPVTLRSSRLPVLRACSFCAGDSKEFFCSEVCRKRGFDLWYKKQFISPKLQTSEDFVQYHFDNLTSNFEQSFIKTIGNSCHHATRDCQSLLELLEMHNNSVFLATKCLSNAFKNHIYEETNEKLFQENALFIAVASITSRYWTEIRDALVNEGIASKSIEIVSLEQFDQISNLNPTIHVHVKMLIERRLQLFKDFDEQHVDEFTLDYLGTSDELFKWIGLNKVVKAIDFERFCRSGGRAIPPELYEEFQDLLVVVRTHPFLPTFRILENLALAIPEPLVQEESQYRMRLIRLLEANPKLHTSAKGKRLLPMLQALDGIVRGKTLDAVGQEMKVSRERVRQLLLPILAQLGVDGLKSLRFMAQHGRQVSDSQRSQLAANLQANLTKFIREHPGISLSELGLEFPHDDLALRRAANRHKALILETFPIGGEGGTKTREDIIQSLKEASLLTFPLSGKAYDQLLEQGLIHGLSRGRVIQVFGSWIAACELAEVEAGIPRKAEYVRNYGYNEMLKVVGQFLVDDDLRGFTGGVHSYASWRSSQELADILPSQGTIRNQIDRSWKRVKELALVELRSGWVENTDQKVGNFYERK